MPALAVALIVAATLWISAPAHARLPQGIYGTAVETQEVHFTACRRGSECTNDSWVRVQGRIAIKKVRYPGWRAVNCTIEAWQGLPASSLVGSTTVSSLVGKRRKTFEDWAITGGDEGGTVEISIVCTLTP